MEKAMGAFLFLKDRLNEPSTFASLAAIAALVGVKIDAGLVQDALNTASLAFGVLGFFVKEAKPLTEIK